MRLWCDCNFEWSTVLLKFTRVEWQVPYSTTKTFSWITLIQFRWGSILTTIFYIWQIFVTDTHTPHTPHTQTHTHTNKHKQTKCLISFSGCTVCISFDKCLQICQFLITHGKLYWKVGCWAHHYTFSFMSIIHAATHTTCRMKVAMLCVWMVCTVMSKWEPLFG